MEQDFDKTHSLNNFEMQRYYQNKSQFNGVYSRNHLRKLKDGGVSNQS